jgi:O-antigen/teichoic acid export membrane protein
MRTQNSIKNISISIFSQIIIILLGFISRKVFLDNLGAEYLGINGLLDNVLSMLALIESGIGTSIVYSLYKPLAENDRPKIIALVKLYKKAYTVLALIILLLCFAFYPFIGKLMKGSESVSYITLIYFIFVAKNMTYYLNAHKVSLINADQKGYILANVNFWFQMITTITKIFVLITTKNYILFLVIEFSIYIIQNLYNGRIVDKKYFYIKTKEKYPINQIEKDSIIKNVKALFLHNIGTYCVFGTDNLLISSFVGVATVGLYSNYTMIMGQLASLLSPVLNGIGASIGNLIAIESKEKSYSVFKVIYLINFWIYSVCVIFLYNLLEPFIIWWLGGKYLLDTFTFIIILVNFYLLGLRSSILSFKIKAGIFVQDKYMPLLEAVINLVAALILVKYIGLSGIFLGTTISTLSIVFWNVPRLVYKHVFNLPVWLYFKRYALYLGLTLFTCLFTTFVCSSIIINNGFFNLVIKGIICVVFPSAIYVAIFYKTEEFLYIKSVISNVTLELKVKFTSMKHIKVKG